MQLTSVGHVRLNDPGRDPRSLIDPQFHRRWVVRPLLHVVPLPSIHIQVADFTTSGLSLKNPINSVPMATSESLLRRSLDTCKGHPVSSPKLLRGSHCDISLITHPSQGLPPRTGLLVNHWWSIGLRIRTPGTGQCEGKMY